MFRRYLVNFDAPQLPQETTDLLVIGSGIAGLYAALKARQAGLGVILVTKERLADCNTDQAQGGIAAALAPGDASEVHLADTLAAGAGLNDRRAVEALVEEGPVRVRELISWGVPFDREAGELAFTREGAHSRRRVLHAGGDATGHGIWTALVQRAREAGIDLWDHVFAVDLVTVDGACRGALGYDRRRGMLVILARATVLATGGAGQLYAATTNPPVATGDGMAMACRAGASLADMEFVQFHPTVLMHPGVRGFLISEAVRGEGAVLRDAHGRRFMPDYHPLAELAPRDVVARAIFDAMAKSGSPYVYLDATSLDAAFLRRRFPTIYQKCRECGLDMARDWLPAAPAAHYFMGGVKTDLWGATDIPGLYACGEVAWTGVHGANRLASNSLLEGLVFAGRAVDALVREAGHLPAAGVAARGDAQVPGDPSLVQEVRSNLPVIMQQYAGIVRDGQGLLHVKQWMAFRQEVCFQEFHDPAAWEAQNMLMLAQAVVEAAICRTESRGAHFRRDFPQSDPAWERHLSWKLAASGWALEDPHAAGGGTIRGIRMRRAAERT